MADISELLNDILSYSPVEKNRSGENSPDSPNIRHSENGVNSTFSPDSPLSPTRHLKIISRDSPDEKSREQRRQKVLTMLSENPDQHRAFYVDPDSDSNNVIIAVAIRDLATCEIEIPRHKYDPFLVLEIINKNAAH